MCNILKMADCRVKRIKIWDSHGPIKTANLWYFSYLILCVQLGHSVHCFHPISTKLYGKHGNQGGIQAITHLGDPPKIKIFMTLLNFC